MDSHGRGLNPVKYKNQAVVVGSGPNGLAAAITLAGEGIEVTVIESSDSVGGGTRSSELTLPGLVHDHCSAAHPFTLDNEFTQQFDLASHGLKWKWAEVEYSHPLDGGEGAAAVRSVDDTTTLLGAGGERWRSLFGSLADNFDELSRDIMGPPIGVPNHPLLMARFGARAILPAKAVGRRLGSEGAQALWAGVAAHAFRPFTSPMSSAIGMGLGLAAHAYGWPVAEGGSGAISAAMVSLLESLGAKIETGRTVRSLSELGDADIVMLDVAPGAAANIAGNALPPRIARALRTYRHGPAAFKVDWAIEGDVPWTHSDSRRAGTVHVGGSLDEIAHAEMQCAKGQMPQQPFVLVCQQYLADPTRSSGTANPLYGYAHVPAGYTGDATSAIESQIERFAPGFKDRVLARRVRNTTQTEMENSNFVGGDIVTGATDMSQLLFRPRVTLNPYRLGIAGTYLCSAATPPGAGAHGMCGYNAAKSALGDLNGSRNTRG